MIRTSMNPSDAMTTPAAAGTINLAAVRKTFMSDLNQWKYATYGCAWAKRAEIERTVCRVAEQSRMAVHAGASGSAAIRREAASMKLTGTRRLGESGFGAQPAARSL